MTNGSRIELIDLLALVGLVILGILIVSIFIPGARSFDTIKLLGSIIGIVVAAVLLIGLITASIASGGKKDEKWEVLKTYGITPFILWLRKSPNQFIKQFLRIAFLNPYITGTLPFAFRQLRAELMILMNWLTRLHTYFGKMGKVEEAVIKVEGIEANFADTPKTYDALSLELDRHRFGGAGDPENSYGWATNRELVALFFKRLDQALHTNLKVKAEKTDTTRKYEEPLLETFNAKFILMKRKYEQFEEDSYKFGLIHRLRSLKIHILDLLALYGVYRHYYRFANEYAVFELWSYTNDDIDKDKPTSNPAVWELDVYKLRNYKNHRGYEIYYETLRRKRIEIVNRKRSELRAELEEKYRRIVLSRLGGVVTRLTPADTDWIDQNVRREYRERYMDDVVYAAEREIKDILVEDKRKEKEEVRKQKILNTIPDQYKLGHLAMTTFGPLRHEVDIRGFVLEDIHAIEIEHRDPKFPGYIRRVRIEDIEDFPARTKDLSKWSWVFGQILKEWRFFLADLRFGGYHPYSRSHSDYMAVINKRSLNLTNPNITTTPPNLKDRAAFDLEALKYSGKWVYWGCKNYWDQAPSMNNPFPTLSTIALSKIITEIIRLQEGESQNTDRFLSYWVWDTALERTPFTTVLGKEEKTS